MCSRPTDEGSSESAAAVVDSSPSQTNLDRYRLHLYNYALQAERLRLSGGWGAVQYNSAGVAAGSVYPSPGRVAFPVHALFHPGVVAAGHGGAAVVGLQGADEPKPQHSYIGLIAMAILGSAEAKLVLSDIYQYILDNYPYFRTRGPGWRNSIRHNLSLNDCFVKAGRSANGKGHYWAIHPANVDDFKKGDFRRRKAQRKVRRHMGLAVDDDGNDSPSPPPLPPPQPPQPQPQTPHHLQQQLPHHHLQLQQQQQQQQQHHHHHHNPSPVCPQYPLPLPPSHHPSPFYFQPIVPQQQSVRRAVPAYRAHKRQFDVASLLAPDPPKRRLVDDPTTTTMTTTGGSCSDEDEDETTTTTTTTTTVTAYRNGGWEQAAAAGLLQRYYEQQLQAAHRLHAFRQSLGLQRMMINGAGQWPAVITALDRNALRLQTPTPPSTPSAHQSSYDAGSCVAAQSTADDHIKSELVD